MLTQARLKEVLHYDPDTGKFTRLISSKPQYVGKLAGSLSGTGHVQIRIDGPHYYGHRLAWLYMTGNWPIEIDHKNRIRDDNRWKNLRQVSHAENCRNQENFSNNTSGHTGVHWFKRDQMWIARIQVEGKRKFLGKFDSKDEAIEARKEAEIKYNYTL